jgi:hypothetical protein
VQYNRAMIARRIVIPLILSGFILNLVACARPDKPTVTSTPTATPTPLHMTPFIPRTLTPTPLVIDTSRAIDVVPRNFDLWTIYPDGLLRFATLYYPNDSIEAERRTEVVHISGVLIRSSSDVMESSVIGGADPSLEIMPGLGSEDYSVYPRASFVRNRNGQPYGFDVLSSRSPYLTAPAASGDSEAGLPPSGTRAFSISIGVADSRHLQVIIAVALPAGTRMVSMCQPVTDDTCPYRTITHDGWTITYFDTTFAAFHEVLHMTFLATPLSDPAPDDLDLREADSLR